MWVGGARSSFQKDSGMSASKKSLEQDIAGLNGINSHLLLQSDDEPHALDVARRIHDRSRRAFLPFVVQDATQLPQGGVQQMLTALTQWPLGPIASAGRGTLVIPKVEQLPDEIQEVLVKIIKRGAPQPRPTASNLPYLEARVIMIESTWEKTHRDLRTVSAFISLSRYEDDL